jgi:capsular exopolysaccharide synthesis family protein
MTDAYDAPVPTLGSYIAVLRRRKLWLIAVTLLGLVAMLGYSLSKPKEYSASAQLLVQPATTNTITGAAAQPITQTDVLTELQLATSAPVKAAVAGQLGGVPSISGAQVGQTNVISLTATAATPARAASVANTYAKAFVAYETSITINNLTATETQLSQQITSIEAQAKALQSNPASTAEATALLNEVTVLKGELAQIEVNGASPSGGVELVTPAAAPSAPSSPKPVRDAILGFILGLLLGIAVALVMEHVDDKVYLKEEVERLTPGARVLALVPMVRSWKDKDKTFLVSVEEPNSVAGEAYLSLRTSLQFAALDTKARVILVTSPGEDEGKSSTVANLGVVLATAGERVVIVSGDLRRPRVGQFLGVEERLGLTTVLRDKCPLEDALQQVPAVDGLWLLPAGERTSDPTAALARPRLADVFNELRKTFDLVIIDSPPLLPVTDALILAQAVDTTLLVVAAGQTRGKNLRRAMEALSLVHAPTIGVVLNEVTKTTGYGYGYGKYYVYGEYKAPALATSGNGNGTQPIAPGQPRGRHKRSGLPSSRSTFGT